MNKSMQGYVPTNVPVRILDIALKKSANDPFEGFLEISTEDSVLRLCMSSEAARNLQIDLGQFIGRK
jgi:hypothetical protein